MTERQQPWSDDPVEQGRILVLSDNPIARSIAAIASTVGRTVVVEAADAGGPGLDPRPGDAVVLCDHDAPDAPGVLRAALASDAAYVAMMASRGRAAGLLDDLVAEGVDVTTLHVPAGHAFVMEARNDPVADFAAFGPDPNQMDGLRDLSTAAARTADGVQRTESVGHSGYLTDNSTSQYNLAVVVAGLPELAAIGGQFGIGDAANYPFARIDQWLR